jgi:hypothetical protein
MKPHRSSFDLTYIRWRAKFAAFESRCFGALCAFVELHFDSLLDRYHREGHESLDDFLPWAVERYLRVTELAGAREDMR